MATIEISATRANNMTSSFNTLKSNINTFKSSSESIHQQSLFLNETVINTSLMRSAIQTNIDRQEDEITSIDSAISATDEFFDIVISKDEAAADEINERKEDFYEKYDYLKPKSEKSDWENFWEGTCSWCKEHWKLIVTVVLVIAAVIVIVATAGTALTAFGAFAVLAAKGVLIGAVVGGLVGGTISAIMGKSFFEGFENGAFGGAVSGLLTAGIGTMFAGGINAAFSTTASLSLSAGKTLATTAIAEFATSVIGDVGDIIFKGDDISFLRVLANGAFSATVGVLLNGVTMKVSAKFPDLFKFNGLNSRSGSWAHVWATQSSRSLRHSSVVGMKTVMKGLGAQFVDGCLDYIGNIISEISNQLFGDGLDYLGA